MYHCKALGAWNLGKADGYIYITVCIVTMKNAERTRIAKADGCWRTYRVRSHCQTLTRLTMRLKDPAAVVFGGRLMDRASMLLRNARFGAHFGGDALPSR